MPLDAVLLVKLKVGGHTEVKEEGADIPLYFVIMPWCPNER